MTGSSSLPPLTLSASPSDLFRDTGLEDYRPIFTHQQQAILDIQGEGDPTLSSALMKQRAYELADALATQAVQDGAGGTPTMPYANKQMLEGLMALSPDLQSVAALSGTTAVGAVSKPDIELEKRGGSLGTTISESFTAGVFNSATMGLFISHTFGGGDTIKDQQEFNARFADDIKNGDIDESYFYPGMTRMAAEWRLSENKRAKLISLASQSGVGIEAVGTIAGFGGNMLGDALLYAGVNLPHSLVGGVESSALASAASKTMGARGIIRRMIQGATSEFAESVFIEIPYAFVGDSIRQDTMGQSTYGSASDILMDLGTAPVFGGLFSGTGVVLSKGVHELQTQMAVSRMTAVPFEVQQSLLASDPVFRDKLNRFNAVQAAAGKDESARALARDKFIKTEFPKYVDARVRSDALASHLAATLHFAETGKLEASSARDTMKDAAAFAKLTGARPEIFATIGDSELKGPALAREIEKAFDTFAKENSFDDTAAAIFRNAQLDAYRKSIGVRMPGVARTGVVVDGAITAPEPDALKSTTDMLDSVRPMAELRQKRSEAAKARHAARNSIEGRQARISKNLDALKQRALSPLIENQNTRLRDLNDRVAAARERINSIRPAPDSGSGFGPRGEQLTAFQEIMRNRAIAVELHGKEGMDAIIPGAAGAYDPKTETLHFSTEAKAAATDTTTHEWIHQIYDTDNATLAQVLHVLSADVMVDKNGVPFHVSPELRAKINAGEAPITDGAAPLFVVGWNNYRTRSAAAGGALAEHWNKATTAVKLEEAVASAVGILFQHPEAARGFLDGLSGPDKALAKVFLSTLLDSAYHTPHYVVPYADAAYKVGQILAKASGDGTSGATIKGMGDMLNIYGTALEKHGIMGEAGIRGITRGDKGYFPGAIPLDGKLDSIAEWYRAQTKRGRDNWGKDVVDKAVEVKEKVAKSIEAKKKPAVQGDHYEVSSKGDKRFSALYAKFKDGPYKGRSIEDVYQTDVKGYATMKEGKGKKPKDTSKDIYGEYKKLWQMYLDENPGLLDDLRKQSEGKTLRDSFAKTENNQARVLTELLAGDKVADTPVKQGKPVHPLLSFLGDGIDTTHAADLAHSRDMADLAYVNYLTNEGTGFTLSSDPAKKEIPVVLTRKSNANPEHHIYTGGPDGFVVGRDADGDTTGGLDAAAKANGIPYQRTLDGLAKLASMGDEVAAARLKTWGKLIENNFHWVISTTHGTGDTAYVSRRYERVFVGQKPKDGDWTTVGQLNYPKIKGRDVKVGLQLKSVSAKTERKKVALARHQIGLGGSDETKRLRKLRFETGVYSLVSPQNRWKMKSVIDSWLWKDNRAKDVGVRKAGKLIGDIMDDVKFAFATPDELTTSIANILADWAVRKYSDSNHKVRNSIRMDIDKLGTDAASSVSVSRLSEPLFAEAHEAAQLMHRAAQDELEALGRNATADVQEQASKSVGQLAYEYLKDHPLLTSPFGADARTMLKKMGLQALPFEYSGKVDAAAEQLMHALLDVVDLSNSPKFTKADADLKRFAETQIITKDHRLEFYDGDTLDAITDKELMTLPSQKEVIVVYTEKYNPADEAGVVTEEDPSAPGSDETREQAGRPTNRQEESHFGDVTKVPEESLIDAEMLRETEWIVTNEDTVRESMLAQIQEHFKHGDSEELDPAVIDDLYMDFMGNDGISYDAENPIELSSAQQDALDLATRYVEMVNGILKYTDNADDAQAEFVKYYDAIIKDHRRRLSGEGPARNKTVSVSHKAAFLVEVAPIVADSIADFARKGADPEVIKSIVNREYTTINMLMDNMDAAVKAVVHKDGNFQLAEGVEMDGPARTIARELVARLDKSSFSKALSNSDIAEWHEAIKAKVSGSADDIGVSAISTPAERSAISDASLSVVQTLMEKHIPSDGFSKELVDLISKSDDGASAYAQAISALYIRYFSGLKDYKSAYAAFEPFGGIKHAVGVINTAADTPKVKAMAIKGDMLGIARYIGEKLDESREAFHTPIEDTLVFDANEAAQWGITRASPDILGAVDKGLTKVTRWAANTSSRPPEFGNKNITRAKPPALSPESSIPQRYSSMKATQFMLGGVAMGFEEFMKANHDYIRQLAAASHDVTVPEMHKQVSGLYNRLVKWETEFKKSFVKVAGPDGTEVEIPPNLARVGVELEDFKPEDRIDVIRRYGYIAAENGASPDSARDMLTTPNTDVAQLSDTGEQLYYGKFMYDAIVAHYKEKMMDTGNHLITHMAVQQEVNTRFSEHHALSKYHDIPYDELTIKQRGEITYDTLQAMILGRPTAADGWALNVENNIRLAESSVVGPFLGELKNLNLDAEFTMDPTISRNILRAAMGMKTDLEGKPLNDITIKLGDLWYNQNLKVNAMFGETGRPVTLSNSFQGLTVTHDKARILGDGTYDKVNTKWFDFLMNPDNLDWEATFRRRGWLATFDEVDVRSGELVKRTRFIRSADFEADANGNVPIETAKANYLMSMWNEMWQESKEVQVDDLDGAGSAAKTHRQSLVFVGDKGLDYIQQYGVETNLGAAMINSLSSAARSAALYKSLGRTPKATVEALVRPLRQGGVLDAVHAESLVGAVGEFTHETSRPVNTRLADITSSLSAITDMLVLPLNGLVQLNDLATTHSVLRQYDMGGLVDSEMYSAIKQLHTGRADPELTNLFIGYGVGGSIIQGELLARMKSGALGSLNRGRDHTMNISLMNALRNAQQRMFVVSSLMKYVEISKKLDAGEALNRAEQRLLAVGGIEPDRMKGLSGAVHSQKIGNRSFDLMDLDKLEDTDLAARLRAVTSHLTTFTSLEPDAGTRAMTVFGTKSGTVIGSIVRLVMKYTAIPAAVQAKTWMRFQNGYGKEGLIKAMMDPRSGAAVHMASMLGLTAVIGYSSYAAVTALTGGEVEDPRDMSAGKLARVFLGANLLGRAYTVMNYANTGDDYRPYSGAPITMATAAVAGAGRTVWAAVDSKTTMAEQVAKTAEKLGQPGRVLNAMYRTWFKDGTDSTHAFAK